jgi:hypothetical protein
VTATNIYGSLATLWLFGVMMGWLLPLQTRLLRNLWRVAEPPAPTPGDALLLALKLFGVWAVAATPLMVFAATRVSGVDWPPLAGLLLGLYALLALGGICGFQMTAAIVRRRNRRFDVLGERVGQGD